MSSILTTPRIIALSAFIHVTLLLYANHVDTHPERYGGLKYTDVDWRVVSDGAKLIFSPTLENRAQGWLVNKLDLNFGNPYERATFRYTPLLPLLLSPSILHPFLGKLILVVASLIIPILLLRLNQIRNPLFWPTHLIWTLNPFVLNITTRGSPEAIICLLVTALLFSLKSAESTSLSKDRSRPTRAAVLLALAVSYKIYPLIYVPTIWATLARRYGWFGWGVWRFGMVTLISMIIVNGLLWSIWGQPFLDHTFLYHLTRLDHRHNFSPYFYPIYLSYFPTQNGISSSWPHSWIKPMLFLLEHPLISFLPQATLMLLVGFAFGSLEGGLELGMFVQTWGFVIFNKVCTSQYYTWFLPLLSPLIPHLHITSRRAILLSTSWITAQALWLGMAYQLEFLGWAVHLWVWAAGLVLVAVSVWVLGEIISAYTLRPVMKTE
ncbi:hypothetical protein TREMEDRAFT_30675 [Tremella mesenterica DSM 1558]|uniref:uncharacterized protein n=1 Tax=Tremella mesenterica (strain ATCC 24925 / CBS 8224 / DSM 1558 / NBRC 9311 / NRRL Y-6157 / RJB 2259-6 / UBC 559-6) TaxID=578456 RepID=UPI0003F4904A|nr:uncharacterized protein TREMEDRAFT_30675 [Tremella mesenterica DSM 1558]EIW69383.1 hypothetical protein TREMEDRAFT_30675 [Tremella mesenterica DSM 1558]